MICGFRGLESTGISGDGFLVKDGRDEVEQRTCVASWLAAWLLSLVHGVKGAHDWCGDVVFVWEPRDPRHGAT